MFCLVQLNMTLSIHPFCCLLMRLTLLNIRIQFWKSWTDEFSFIVILFNDCHFQFGISKKERKQWIGEIARSQHFNLSNWSNEDFSYDRWAVWNFRLKIYFLSFGYPFAEILNADTVSVTPLSSLLIPKCLAASCCVMI